MSKILITGGAGYIGSMLCTKLLEEGHMVTVVDLLKYDKGSLNHLYFNKNFKLICSISLLIFIGNLFIWNWFRIVVKFFRETNFFNG